MRSSPLIEYSSTVLILCLWIGAITTVFSSLIGLFQQDIKKIIAYSTMSQLAQEYKLYLNINIVIFRHQTICVKVINIAIFIVILRINSQITKAHDYYNHIRDNLFNSSIIHWLYYYIVKYVTMSVRWKIITISKLVGISEAIRLILILVKFKLISLTISIFNYTYNNFYSLTCIYKNYRNIHTNININHKDLSFNQWLAGLIDGDGYFILTKKGYSSCEITMDARDKKALYEIKQKYGGSIKPISNANALRYKLRHKKGLSSLINDINGLLRNPTRLLQINKLCVKYDIEIKYPKPLTFNDGWLSGFIDSDGSLYYNEASQQVFICISQKNRHLLEPLIALYGGRIDILSPKIEAFKYVIYRKVELFNLIDNYFSKYPLKTEKVKKIKLIKDFYILRLDRNTPDITKYNKWILFKDRWEKYKD